jgi:hypothetical protein
MPKNGITVHPVKYQTIFVFEFSVVVGRRIPFATILFVKNGMKAKGGVS